MADVDEVLHISDRDGVKLVRLRTGSVRSEAEVEALGRGLMSAAEVPGQRMVLSFLGVEQLTSLVLGQLIRVHKRLAESAGEIRLADIDPQIYEVFVITHLDRLFKIFDREDEAVASFLGGAEA
ncbi:MAG TPA: STAS domain-containing protein [Phycisphaerae bacterium]|nr:STAS domain-containing protein [Phycisphaerae bacterium]